MGKSDGASFLGEHSAPEDEGRKGESKMTDDGHSPPSHDDETAERRPKGSQNNGDNLGNPDATRTGANGLDLKARTGGLFKGLFRRKSQTPEPDLAAVLADPVPANGPKGRVAMARREMIERVVAFDEKRVDDVMAPRADMVAVDLATPFDELVRAFSEAGHSRLPIYRGDLDDPIGMAHIKDVVDLMANPEKKAALHEPILEHIRRDVLYVPPSMRVTDLLLRMQASRIHMALVIDEYGGTDGLLTIEDLVEEIVGEINDEHDEDDEPAITPKSSGWEADARVELDDFNDHAGVDLHLEDDEVDTLGGLAVALAGRVPQRGEVLIHPAGYELEVCGADPRKVRKLLIRQQTVLSKTAAKAAE